MKMLYWKIKLRTVWAELYGDAELQEASCEMLENIEWIKHENH